MTHIVLTPYVPEDAIKKMLNTLRQMNAKVDFVRDRSIKAKIKIGFMKSILIQANLMETPFGSIVEFMIPDFYEEQLVDEVFFGNRAVAVGQREKTDKIESIIKELKASIDGLDEEEARRNFGLHTRVKFLTRCPHCGSNVRKGFKCAYCNYLMVEFE